MPSMPFLVVLAAVLSTSAIPASKLPLSGQPPKLSMYCRIKTYGKYSDIIIEILCMSDKARLCVTDATVEMGLSKVRKTLKKDNNLLYCSTIYYLFGELQ